MNAGHYIHGVLDFDEINLNCQDTRCNKWLSGNLANYTMFLVKKYGLKKVEELHERARQAKKGHKYSREELENIKIETKRKLKALDDRP
jgi:hypothetical protein